MKLGDHKVRKVTRPDFRKKVPNFFYKQFLSKIEVFADFLNTGSINLAENPYLDRLDHYLQLSNWSHVQENPFFGHFR